MGTACVCVINPRNRQKKLGKLFAFRAVYRYHSRQGQWRHLFRFSSFHCFISSFITFFSFSFILTDKPTRESEMFFVCWTEKKKTGVRSIAHTLSRIFIYVVISCGWWNYVHTEICIGNVGNRTNVCSSTNKQKITNVEHL